MNDQAHKLTGFPAMASRPATQSLQLHFCRLYNQTPESVPSGILEELTHKNRTE